MFKDKELSIFDSSVFKAKLNDFSENRLSDRFSYITEGKNLCSNWLICTKSFTISFIKVNGNKDIYLISKGLSVPHRCENRYR